MQSKIGGEHAREITLYHYETHNYIHGLFLFSTECNIMLVGQPSACRHILFTLYYYSYYARVR